MDLIITILPVVTKDLPISPRFTPYNFFIAMQVQHSYNSSRSLAGFYSLSAFFSSFLGRFDELSAPIGLLFL